MSSQPLIDIRHLTKTIGDTPILSEVSLQLHEGRIGGIIGKSGAGKTTLLRCLNGLERATSGDIYLFGKNVATLEGEHRHYFQRKIGTVFQQFNLLKRRTVFDNVAFPLEIRKVPKVVRRDRVMDMLRLVGLENRADAYPSELSGGQSQRVAIARAIAADVSLLLCDEFTSALDPETTLEILSLLSELNQKLNLTILLITHDMNVVREICDDVFVLNHGYLVEHGTIDDILLRPQSEVTKSLIGSLFNQDLPHLYQSRLSTIPTERCHVFLRMIFADKVAKEPIIAALVEQFHLPVNIIAGHLDHIRETAFGQLIISFPHVPSVLSNVEEYLRMRQVSVELLGYVHA